MIGNANWFEIPTANFERAIKFYEALFQVTLVRENFGGDVAMFPADESSTSGALIAPQDDYAPSASGPVIYLDAGADLQPLLDRAGTSGGRVLLGKTPLPPGMGFYAHMLDCEGNRVGLHSPA